MNKSVDQVLKELILGIFIYGGIVQIIILLAVEERLYTSRGLWIGILVACFMGIHMKRSLEDALDLGADGAVKHARKCYGIRMGVVILAFGLTFYFRAGSVVSVFIGAMGLKISAYMQPYLHKVFQKVSKSK